MCRPPRHGAALDDTAGNSSARRGESLPKSHYGKRTARPPSCLCISGKSPSRLARPVQKLAVRVDDHSIFANQRAAGATTLTVTRRTVHGTGPRSAQAPRSRGPWRSVSRSRSQGSPIQARAVRYAFAGARDIASDPCPDVPGSKSEAYDPMHR